MLCCVVQLVGSPATSHGCVSTAGELMLRGLHHLVRAVQELAETQASAPLCCMCWASSLWAFAPQPCA